MERVSNLAESSVSLQYRRGPCKGDAPPARMILRLSPPRAPSVRRGDLPVFQSLLLGIGPGQTGDRVLPAVPGDHGSASFATAAHGRVAAG